ncbi:nucleotidyltransferase [Flaviaesturariibacter flavus]|uniref:Nucleotidyltransferase n=1 Tax=Flaviaesturariibacter flavus TaxID=2502780 RepID=A0A4R1BJP3_9BACT|nr:nucleotidyltransferase [Flaviaesturariibacter flavus]TCJ17428.1 nucleotidyltransferase [Flaviaesturariibacter flavus]
MKPTLVIMAAGMASRYGSMKQIQQFGPSGETIMDYSIFDAIRAGFGKVVFIIRRDFAEDFKNIFEPKLKGRIETEYVFQDMDAYLPEGFQPPADRKKPWGTSHAILCAKSAVTGPFAVINADDFYGADGFVKAAQFLQTECDERTYALVGYQLSNTLSENGSVSRGVCQVDDKGNLVAINERLKIYRKDGPMVSEEPDGSFLTLEENTRASMNFWCFHPSIFPFLQEEFKTFLEQQGQDPKAEFLIPYSCDRFIKSGRGVIKVLETSAQWFGVTYKEDAPVVTESVRKQVESGAYPNNLWNNQ